MKIAVLSFSFLTPEHITRLKKLGEVTEYQSSTNEQDAIARLKDIEVAVADCWEVPMNQKLFESVPSLKYVSLNSTGFDRVDIKAAKENEIKVANVPGFSTDAVAEHAIALLLAVARHIPMSDKSMRTKPFQVDPANRAHDLYQGVELRGKTLGIIGLGQIGTRVAELGQGFGMKVIGYNRSPKTIPGVEIVELSKLLETSDFISINAALVDEFKNLINGESLERMKPTAILINTARGGFVDDQALATALRERRIAGFGTDFLTDWSENNPLLALDNVVLTPHSAFYTEKSVKNMADIIVANIESYAAGKPANVVNS